ncbi:MAG: hypothetical protein DRP79_03450 [Planctomycetota bacterium]|nr:MAG: hypothetical protein DRP79_03450 [Planctomycetota bacterium]
MKARNATVLFLLFPVVMAFASGRALAAEGDRIAEILVVRWGTYVSRDKYTEAIYADQIREKIFEATGGFSKRAAISQVLLDMQEAKILFRYRYSEQPVGPGRVRLLVEVEENIEVRSVKLIGLKAMDAERLMSVIHTRVGQPLSLPTIHQDARRIESLYHEEGYLFVSVSAPVEGHKNGVVLFVVEEGPLVRVRRVGFIGNYHFSDKKLMSLMNTKRRKLFGLLAKGVYSENILKEDLERIAKFYRSEGYLNVVVGIGKIEYNESRTDMYITIYIEEHELFHVGKIHFRGVRYFTEDEIKSRLRLKEKAPFKVSDYVSDLATIKKMYAAMAYIDAVVGETAENPTIVYHKDEPIVDLYFNITENREVYVGNIYVRGNTYTQDKVIRRELSFAPGEKFSMSEIEASRARLARLGGYQDRYFQDVTIRIAPKKEERVEDGRRVRDVHVEVKESESFGRIRFGAAISSNEGVLGDVSLIRPNFDIADLPKDLRDMFVDRTAFLGAGQYFSISAQPGTESSRYSVNFSEPYLFGTPTSMGLSLFMWDRERESFDEDRQGFNMGLGRRLPKRYSIGLNFRIEQVDIDNVDFWSPGDVKDVEGSNSLVALRMSLTKDTRKIDRFFKPYGGYRSFASIEPIFGDFELVRFAFGSTRYRTIYEDDAGYKHIIKLEGEVGFITGDSPIYERFFLGGANNLRGFDYRGVGPMQRGDPVGGDTTLYGSVEYSFPVAGDSIRGVLFFDFGTVNEDTADFGNMRASAGFGIRIFSPQIPIPIALDFGFPIRADDDDDEEVVSFTIGTNF